MEKETLSNYGWVIIVIIIILMLITVASPVGVYIFDSIDRATTSVQNFDISDDIFISGKCATDLTVKQIESSDLIYPIGKNNPNDVLAIFNKDRSGVVIIKNGVDSDGLMKNFTSTNSPFRANRGTLKNIDIREGVTSIGLYAFYGCVHVKHILLPESIKRVENFALTDCTSMSSVHIPKNVEYIVGHAFTQRLNFTTVTVSPQNKHFTTIDGVLFSKDLSVLYVVPCGLQYKTCQVPNTVKKIWSYAFCNMRTMTDIEIPEGVEVIEHYAFGYCSGLTEIKLPSTLKILGNYVFPGCTGLKSIDIPEGVSIIKDHTFLNCTSLESVTIPASVEEIHATAFDGCTSLKTVYGKSASRAQTWAYDNGYEFVAI